MESLTIYFEKIREHIKQIDTLNTNFYSNYEWDIILACIDTMEDAQEAIDYYKVQSFPTDCGGKYLFVYGLFQALILQQDSINTFLKFLGIDKIWTTQNDCFLTTIRNSRNDIVGHPTNRTEDKKTNEKAVIRLTRSQMSKNSLDYTIYKKDETYTEYINPIKYIKQQEKQIVPLLKIIIQKLKTIAEQIEK